jgi:MT0933-like antitoxin protein
MGLFDEVTNLVGEAEKLAKQHPDEVKSALAKAEQFADDQTGHKFTSQLQEGAAQAGHFLDAEPAAPAGPTEEAPKP